MNADPAALPSRPSPGAAGARLGELYAAHARMVHGVCRVMLRDVLDAEDATQQVFLSAYRSLLAGTTIEKEGAWLGTIARNECRSRIESRMRTPLATAEVDTLVTAGVEEQAEGRANAAELYAELAALPSKQREAVVLRDLYGLRYDEVATALGTSRPAVEALLFRARRRLQQRLRPRLAAGVLVVPLAIHDSLAYAVPGFASTAFPAAAVGGLAAAPLLAKLAAGGVTVVLAGSAGVAVERGLHDRPSARKAPLARPTPAVTRVVAESTQELRAPAGANVARAAAGAPNGADSPARRSSGTSDPTLVSRAGGGADDEGKDEDDKEDPREHAEGGDDPKDASDSKPDDSPASDDEPETDDEPEAAADDRPETDDSDADDHPESDDTPEAEHEPAGADDEHELDEPESSAKPAGENDHKSESDSGADLDEDD